jgi:hypothetical protein
MVSTSLMEKIATEFTPPTGDYVTWPVERKLKFLWSRIETSAYEELPALTAIDVLGLFFTTLRTKMDERADEAPAHWKKAIHAHGAVAKVRYTPINSPYTGLWQGAEGLLRLSLTGDPAKRGFAPGLALKLLADGQPSANLSALYTLTGQGQDYNFGAHPLSNIVPVVNEFGPQFINGIFRRVTSYPTKLSLQDFGNIDRQGQTINQPNSPEQIFLVPTAGLKFASDPHDFRDDFLVLGSDITLFTVHANDPTSPAIGQLTSNSAFICSAYGDSRLFFRHRRFRDR